MRGCLPSTLCRCCIYISYRLCVSLFIYYLLYFLVCSKLSDSVRYVGMYDFICLCVFIVSNALFTSSVTVIIHAWGLFCAFG